MKPRYTLPFGLLLLLYPTLLNAASWHVDDDNQPNVQDGSALHPFANIQNAVQAAGQNDTIKVAAGSYPGFENMGKALVIQGGYVGGSPAQYVDGPGGDFNVASDDPQLTVISAGAGAIGILLTRFDFEPFHFTISNLRVSDNLKGIVCDELVSWPHVEDVTVEGCIIEDNGIAGETSLGAGILVAGTGHRLLNNIIRNNRGGRGPAICGNFDAGDSLLVEGNRIEDNTGYDDHCGGIYLAGYAEIRNNLISGNTLQNTYGWGGGMLILGTGRSSGNIITGNHAPSYGGAVFVDEGGVLYMDHDLVHGNTTDLEGAAIAADHGDPGSSYLYIDHCTIANNHSTTNGLGGNAIFLDVSSFATVTNSIVHGNGEGDDFQVAPGSGLTMAYTLCEEPMTGEGVFTADPQFADAAAGDFHVRSTAGRYDPILQEWVVDPVHSPTIDAGDPASPYVNEPQPHGGRVNLGADGNTPFASLSAATAVAELIPPHVPITTYPVPADDRLAVGLQNAGPGPWRMRVFDAKGSTVLEQRAVTDMNVLDVAQLDPGVYTLKVNDEQGRSLAKLFVVQR